MSCDDSDADAAADTDDDDTPTPLCDADGPPAGSFGAPEVSAEPGFSADISFYGQDIFYFAAGDFFFFEAKLVARKASAEATIKKIVSDIFNLKILLIA